MVNKRRRAKTGLANGSPTRPVSPVISLFAPGGVGHVIETTAFYLTRGGCRVRIVTEFEGDERGEHPWSLQRLAKTDCELVEIGSPPQESDLLIFPLVRHGKISNELAAWRAKAAAVAFLLSDIRYDDHKDRLRELVRSWPHYLAASFAIYRHSPVARWRNFPFYWQKPVYFTSYLHPHYFAPGELSNAFSGVSSTEQRRFRLGFLGNRQPPRRAVQLAQCRQAIDDAGITMIGPDLEPSESENQAVWVEYGESGSIGSNGLDPTAYLRVLSDMDFCVSPPGWDWYTHRTIEAIVRGSVPILAEPEVYNLDLRDRENCIVVNNSDWLGATRRALAMPQSEVVRLRRSVLALRERLAPDAAAEHFCFQLFG
jgi:hypothetical protein